MRTSQKHTYTYIQTYLEEILKVPEDRGSNKGKMSYSIFLRRIFFFITSPARF